ncbi:MAG: 4Fe-4S dicluster domain-containing protein [Nitrospirota bacterium]
MKRVYPKEDACIDCKLCEVACLVEHSETKDIFKAYREAPRTLSKAFVEEDGPNSISIQCRHCTDAPCIDACITGAMQRADDDSPVIVDRDKCVGCWMCIMACPFGAIQMDIRKKDKHKVSSKCDLCPGRNMPACVEICPNRALFFEDRG